MKKTCNKYNALIFDSCYAYRIGLEDVLKPALPNTIFYLTSNKRQLSKFLKIVAFDLIIIDSLNANPSHIKQIKKDFPKIKIIVFTQFNNSDHALKLYEQGINGYILKDNNEEFIMSSIIDVLTKNAILPNKELNFRSNKVYDQEKQNIKKLSNREIQVAQLVLKGHRSSEISGMLDVTMSTVCTHKRRIFLKTKTKNIVELIKLFKENEVKNTTILLNEKGSSIEKKWSN